MVEIRNAHKILVEKSERKRPFVRPGRDDLYWDVSGLASEAFDRLK
jgi:hypothetical protein